MPAVYVYSLSHPETGEVRYIGKTDNVQRRYAQHKMACHLKRRSRKNGWLKSMLGRGLQPVMAVLEEWPDHREAALAEERLIAQYRAGGHDLLNLTNGGDGAKGYRPTPEHRAALKAWHVAHKEEHRAKVSAQKKLQWADPQKRQKMAEALERRLADPEHAARTRAGLLGFYADPALRARRAEAIRRAMADPEAVANRRAAFAAMKGRPDVKAKIAEATRRRWADPEYKARLSAKQKGRTISQKTRDAVSLANKTRVVSEETRKKMSANMTRRHAARRQQRAAAAAATRAMTNGTAPAGLGSE